MSQQIKLYGVAAEPLKLRTATRFRYVIVLGHWQAAKLVKYASSDSLATATRKLDKALRSPLWAQSVGCVVDLRTGELVAMQRGYRASHGNRPQVLVTGSRGR
jgi:hypothetical protein